MAEECGEPVIIVTVVTRSNLPQAKVLSQSIKRFHSEVKVVVCLLERHIDQHIDEHSHFDEVVLASQTWSGHYDQVLFKYTAKEAAYFTKALMFNYIFNSYPKENQVLYLDSDMEVLAPLHDLQSMLEHWSILLTPSHLYSGAEKDDVQHGVYHTGLIGVSRTPSGLGFVQWWMKRLERHGFLDNVNLPQRMVAEPKWMNLVPALFENTQVLKHPGYNIGSWNHREREITKDGGGRYLANGETLYIKHYYGVIDRDREKEANNPEYRKQRPLLDELIQQYTAQLDAHGWNRSDPEPWSYQYFTSGEEIKPSTRLLYRNNLFLEYKYPDPFSLSNEFFEWGMFGELPPVTQSESKSEPTVSPTSAPKSRPSGVIAIPISYVLRRKKPSQRSMRKSLVTRSRRKARTYRKSSRSRSTIVHPKPVYYLKDGIVKKQRTWSFPHKKAFPLLKQGAKLGGRVGSQ